MVRANRKTAVLTVEAVKTYTKDQFSDDKAHGEAERPELQLACGGRFDEKAGHSANVVVIAHPLHPEDDGPKAGFDAGPHLEDMQPPATRPAALTRGG
ncbi:MULTISPECIES: sortase family protein [Streptomyces]|uniref:Uncharacterized protein n=1 Tax=Streptomyces globisporus C-1027 TaxID=1172567 RepID=A0A0U3LMK6_STRGL|nr:hypothetical protein WQO_00245 [Streptomyces globisporus C-1027]